MILCVIGQIEEGRKIIDVAREFEIAQALFHGWKSFKTTGMCSRRPGRSCLMCLQKTDISSFSKRNRRTTAQGCFYASTDLPKNCFQTFEGLELRTQTCTRQHRTARLQWCSITIGLNRTEHYYSQMRVGSVCDLVF
ncbi:hypothetical protein TNCV_1365631 [Trichonephila clavipes]|nr:hypothetical protein TNCV_1365631 [Trichonephila clavipes]